MAERTIEQRIRDIIVKELVEVKPEQVTLDARFLQDLKADSLDLVEVIMAVEKEFDIEIDDKEAEKLQTFGDVVRYIEEKKQQA
jgi:acyl carrier protein